MQKIWPHKIKAVIFDNDGTLVDTEWAYSWAHEQITGQPLAMSLKAKLMGKTALESCTYVCKVLNLSITPEEFVEKRNALIDKCWDDVKIMPGALDLAKTLKEKGIKISIATSSKRPTYEKKMAKLHDFESLFDYIICGSDVERGKPFPDIFLAAMNKYGDLKPEECIVVEDSPLGIHAANVAGMASIFVPDPKLDADEALKAEGCKPEITIKSLEEFPFDAFEFA